MKGHDLADGLNAESLSGKNGLTGSSVSHGVFARLVSGHTLLRATPSGELLSLLMLAHSLISTVLWISYSPQNPVGLLLAAAGLWIALRSVGAFSGERWTVVVSVLFVMIMFVLSITGISAVPIWLRQSILSPRVSLAILSIVVLFDFLDCRARRHIGLSQSERRRRDGGSLKLLLAGLFLAWGLGVPVATSIHRMSHPATGPVAMDEMSFPEHVGFRCGEALVTFCFFALGCNIGSFLNVVVWRMPLGRSIVYEKSSCPGCGTGIAGRDNIPIFGWLGLGGQCRTCRCGISSRYPLVEAMTGGIFLLLYFAELISGGANLPVRSINLYRGVLWIIMYAKWDLIGLYLFHCFLFCLLIVLTLMAIDRNRVPFRLLAFMLAVTSVTPVIFPHLMLIPWTFPRDPAVGPASVTALLSTLIGLGVGLLIGLIAATARDGNRWKIRLTESHEIPAFALIGAALGWQAVVTILGFYGLLLFLRYLGTGTASRFASDLLVLTLLHHLTWRLQWLSVSG